jgi:ketosteroid isomerase-like protein
MAMTAQQTEQLVDSLYTSTAAGEWEAAAAMLTDDFVVTEADGLPMAGVYRGRNALKDLFLKVIELVDVAGFDRVQTTVGGDYAVCILSIRFADPALAPAELCELFRFREGKCCEIKPYYFDPAQFIAAAEAKRAAAAV